jgi:hypothetical protein
VSSSGTPPRASQSNQDSIVNEPSTADNYLERKEVSIGYGRLCGVSSAFFVSFVRIFVIQGESGLVAFREMEKKRRSGRRNRLVNGLFFSGNS